MKIHTSRFGDIDIDNEKLITFQEGILGFEEYSDFALITSEDTDPFMWLQAVEEPDLALSVLNPFKLFGDYKPMVPESALADIGKPTDEDIILLAVSVIPKDALRMTANLVSPILINARTNLARQVVLENSPYMVRQPIYEAIHNLVNGGEGVVSLNAEA